MPDTFTVGQSFGNALTNAVTLLAAGAIEFDSDDIVAELVDFAGSLATAGLLKQDEIAAEIGATAPAPRGRAAAAPGRGASRGGGRSSGGRGSGGFTIKDPGAPLSDAQYNKLLKLGAVESEIETLTKQQASDMIESLI